MFNTDHIWVWVPICHVRIMLKYVQRNSYFYNTYGVSTLAITIDFTQVATGQYTEETHPLKRNTIIWFHGGYRTADRTKYNRQIAKVNIARPKMPVNQNTLHTMKDNEEAQWRVRLSLRLVRCCQKGILIWLVTRFRWINRDERRS